MPPRKRIVQSKARMERSASRLHHPEQRATDRIAGAERADQPEIAGPHVLVVFLEGDDRAGRRRIAKPLQHRRRAVLPDLVAEGELLKLGSRLAVGHVRVHAEGSQELVADASLTYSIPPR